jgi:hypothetical protein
LQAVGEPGANRRRGRSYQPRYVRRQLVRPFAGGSGLRDAKRFAMSVGCPADAEQDPSQVVPLGELTIAIACAHGQLYASAHRGLGCGQVVALSLHHPEVGEHCLLRLGVRIMVSNR